MTNFPVLRPTSRRITQGQYAVKRFTSIAGTGVTRAYGSQPFNSRLDLEFNNISDIDALAIVNTYEEARGNYGALNLPSSLWDGMENELQVQLLRDYTWRFAEQPNLTSGTPGVSNISVKLEGQRDS
jgi:hypothetical protein